MITLICYMEVTVFLLFQRDVEQVQVNSLVETGAFRSESNKEMQRSCSNMEGRVAYFDYVSQNLKRFRVGMGWVLAVEEIE